MRLHIYIIFIYTPELVSSLTFERERGGGGQNLWFEIEPVPNLKTQRHLNCLSCHIRVRVKVD